MASIYYESPLEVTADEAWKFIDAYSRSEVHVFDVCTSERQEGPYRVVTTEASGEIRELFVSNDAAARRHSYTVEDLFGATHHNAYMQVREGADGRGIIIWATDVLPDSFAEDQREFWDSLFADLVKSINQSVA